MALVMSMGITAAFAVDISVERDGTYAGGTDTDGGRTYTWYKVFSASYTANSSTGGQYDKTTGAPGDVTGTADAVAYQATAAVAAKLGNWVAAAAEDNPTTTDVDESKAHWVRASGNNWFDLTPIAGSTNYSVKWVNSSITSETAQAAAAWLKANEVYETGKTGSLTWNESAKKWEATGLDAGYYLLESNTGDNLVAATSDIAIKEKNAYPPLDKTQADEDNATQTDDPKNVAVGDVLTYEVKVTIPATAKAGDRILVWDKKTDGLTYNNNVAVKEGGNTGNATVGDPAAADVDASWTWSKLITVTEGSEGKDVVFTFTMTVNEDALVTVDKKNTSGLKYGNDKGFTYDSVPDEVEYKTYFAGIKKIDGTTKEALKGVQFTLKEAGTDFKVSKNSDGVYVPDANGSATVETDNDGLIIIRGLDQDKAYTLTETKTLDGYNMLDKDVTLALQLDTITKTDSEGTTTTTSSFDTAKAKTDAESVWGEVENNKGTLLPSTGGIGTTIFYVVGSILVVAAGVLLITKKRMSREG